MAGFKLCQAASFIIIGENREKGRGCTFKYLNIRLKKHAKRIYNAR